MKFGQFFSKREVIVSKSSAKKSVMGRPPAEWVHVLMKLDRPSDEYLDYHDLSNMFDLTIRSVHSFCTNAAVKGEYYQHESKKIRKRFKVSELKKSAKAYIASRTN